MIWRKFAGWEFAVAVLTGTWAAHVLPNAFYGEGAAELVTVLGFLAAAFVPAMALGATAIRAGGFTVKRIRALGAAVDRQIRLFGGLFLYTLAACAVAIFGKLMRWTLPPIPLSIFDRSPLDLSFLFPGFLTFLLVFLGLRSVAFISGVLSILRLTTAVAEDEARARDHVRDRVGADDLAGYEMPKDYAARVELPH